jgi:hypothetical protein
MADMISVDFDYIVLFIGTMVKDNLIATELSKIYGDILKVVETSKLYNGDKDMFKEHFSTDFFSYLNKEKNGCVIFDDLMTELAQCDVLVNSFTKTTSKWNLSMIHLTQNLFFKGSGKHSIDASTLYRNSHYLVIFYTPVDSTVLNIIAKRISPAAYSSTASLLQHVVREHRYIFIDGHLNTPRRLMFRSNILGVKGKIPYQRVFELEEQHTSTDSKRRK